MTEHESALEGGDGGDSDRRRFLILATKLGVAVPPVVTLALAPRSYAAASGFTDPVGTDPGGTDPGGTGGSSSGSGNRLPRLFLGHGGGQDGDHDHHRN